MKKNMLASMDRLEIDEGLRVLIGKLWKHSYRTTASCEGHNSRQYIMFTGGDGWFEEHAQRYGLSKIENGDCCNREFQDEVRKHGLDPKDFVDKRKTCVCGAGVNGYSVYRGRFVRVETTK